MVWKILEFNIRLILKNRLFSAINIIGLAIGLSACLMIALFVHHEVSYDRHWAKADRLHNLYASWTLPSGWTGTTEEAPGPWKEALTNYFPEEIATSTRFVASTPVFKINEKVFEQKLVWTDTETATMFDMDIVAGDITLALDDPRAIALSATVAEKLFGATDILGETLLVSTRGRDIEYTVKAIYENPEKRSVLDLPALVSIKPSDFAPSSSGDISQLDHWDRAYAQIYIELAPQVNISTVSNRLRAMVDSEAIRSHFEGSISTPSEMQEPVAHAITSMRLTGPAGGSIYTVMTFSVIGLLILLIAVINFINLSTTRSAIRAKEVAVRKTMGAGRSSLIWQYLTESLFTTAVATVFALVFSEMLLPIYNEQSGLALSLDYANPIFIASILGTTILLGLLAGLYPAFVLSSVRPGSVLKANRTSESVGSVKLRALLVVVQFTIATTLIIAALVVYLQRLYTSNHSPGFNKDNLLVIENMNRADAAQNQKAFQQLVEGLAAVDKTSLTTNAPTLYNTGATSVTAPSVSADKSVTLFMNFHDSAYFETMEIPILAGRPYSEEYSEDLIPTFSELRKIDELERNIVINASAARQLGLGTPEDALGKTITARLVGTKLSLRVVGVAADVYLRGVRQQARPRIFFHMDRAQPLLAVRYSGSEASLLADLEQLWKQTIPSLPFKYTFIDRALAAEFNGDRDVNLTLTIYSGLAILLACSGLYGLASFATMRRVREIGIRKVLGASVWDIVKLLMWQFSRPVLVANLIAWPLAAYLMASWLMDFPVHIELWLLLPLCLIAGLISVSIAWGTVGSNAYIAARKNPIHTLRYE